MLKLKNDIIHADYIVSFGDAGNDYDMIKDADFGICMGNGTEKCKKVAYMITDDNNHDGIAKAIEQLYLSLSGVWWPDHL